MIWLWFIVIAARVWMDRKGAKRNYFFVNGALAVCSILHGALLDLPYREDQLGGGYIPWNYLELLVWQMCTYWLFFEIGINLFMKRIKDHGFWKGLLYYDQSEGDSGKIDRFFAKYPKLHTPAKLIALIIFVLLTLKIN